MRRSAGFTLFELLIVMFLMGVAGTLAVSSLDRFALRNEEKRWFDKTQQELVRLRNKAILGGSVIRAEVDFARGEVVQLEESRRRLLFALPVQYQFHPAHADESGERAAGTLLLFFFPDGSAADAQFLVRTPTQGERLFRIVGLTGKIERFDVGAS